MPITIRCCEGIFRGFVGVGPVGSLHLRIKEGNSLRVSIVVPLGPKVSASAPLGVRSSECRQSSPLLDRRTRTPPQSPPSGAKWFQPPTFGTKDSVTTATPALQEGL